MTKGNRKSVICESGKILVRLFIFQWIICVQYKLYNSLFNSAYLFLFLLFLYLSTHI